MENHPVNYTLSQLKRWASQQANEIKAELNAGHWRFSNKIQNNDRGAFEYFNSVMNSRKANTTMQKDKRAIDLAVEFFGTKERGLKSFTKQEIVQFRDYVQQKEDMAQGTKEQYYNAFKNFFTKARKDFIIDVSPCDDITIPTGTTKAREHLTKEEIQMLIDAPIKETQIIAKKMFLFSCFTGVAYAELRSLKWGDIEYRDKCAYLTYYRHKTGMKKPITTPLSDDALAMINYDRKKIYPLDELIFQTTLHYNTINDYIKYWCLENGIRKNITTHIGRHSFAVMWAAMGGNPFHLKEILGHSDIRQTEIYYKIQATDIRISMEQLPKFNLKGLKAV
ncbi:MAG: tyrosine-type recombinase/integrase [Flavobacteriaceae bacterium]